MSHLSYIQGELKKSSDVVALMLGDTALQQSIEQAAGVLLAAFRTGKKVLLAGNGGSAADAQHISAEFVSRLKFNRGALPSIALTTDTSILTAIGNDYGFDTLFTRQVEAYGQAGDVFWGITTSGKSPNVIQGFKAAKARGLKTIALCGSKGLVEAGLCDVELRSPSPVTTHIQECHIIIAHILCDIVERTLFTPPAA